MQNHSFNKDQVALKLLTKSNYRVLKVCVGFGGPEAMPGGMNSREGIYGVRLFFSHILPEMKAFSGEM